MRVDLTWESGGHIAALELESSDTLDAVRAYSNSESSCIPPEGLLSPYWDNYVRCICCFLLYSRYLFSQWGQVRLKAAAVVGLHPSLVQLTYRGDAILTGDSGGRGTVGSRGIQADDILRLTALPEPQVIRVNVGGSRYITLLSTLRAFPSSQLARMFGCLCLESQAGPDGLMEGVAGETSTGGLLPRDPADDSYFFIDRHGPSFEYILTFLRDGVDAALPTQVSALKQLAAEARYYGLDELAARCALAGPRCSVHSLATLVNECGGGCPHGATEAEIVALSEAELRRLLEQLEVNALFARRILSQVAAQREQARAETEAHSNCSLVPLTVTSTDKTTERLRAGLDKLGAHLSEAGLRTLTDAGLTELRAICKLDMTGARGYGLSDEDATAIGAVRQPSSGVTISLGGSEADANEQHHDPEKYRGYIVHAIAPHVAVADAITIKVAAVLLKWSGMPDKCAIIGQGSQLNRGARWASWHHECGDANGPPQGDECWFVSRFEPAVPLSVGDLIVAENVSNAARYFCKSSTSGEQLQIELGDGRAGLVVESCRSATIGRLRYTPNGHQLLMKLVLQ